MFLAVSMNVSPLDRLLPEEENSTVSAPSRRAASEKLLRVRVEFSKNRLASVRPASTLDLPPAAVGGFFERLGRIENAGDFLGRQALQIEQMPPGPDRGEMREVGGESAHAWGRF